MKLGMIFECGPQGADKKVCEYLVQKICPGIEIVSITLDNKQKLLRDSGSSAALLLSQGCSYVLIIWDLYPPWGARGQRPCRHEDRQAVLQGLQQANVQIDLISLVCIEAELESWLLADERALSEVLSRPTYHARVPRQRAPETIQNAKGKLRDIYRQQAGRVYNDQIDAIRIVQAMPDLNRVRRACGTFCRFEEKLLAVCQE
jgi:hypothetical protein